jgi:transcriptional regulator with XRE-family HTH domain
LKSGQPKKLNNFEKGGRLRDLRKERGYTQRQMAGVLDIDATYLSQLENGRKEVRDWHLRKAEAWAGGFDKSIKVKVAALPGEAAAGGARFRCHAYLDRVLDACAGDEDQLSWTYVELTRHFPFPTREGGRLATANSTKPSDAAKLARRAAGESESHPG